MDARFTSLFCSFQHTEKCSSGRLFAVISQRSVCHKEFLHLDRILCVGVLNVQFFNTPLTSSILLYVISVGGYNCLFKVCSLKLFK